MVVEEVGVAAKAPHATQRTILDGKLQDMLTYPRLARARDIGNLENQVLYAWSRLHARGKITFNQKLKIEGSTNSRIKTVTADLYTVFCIAKVNRKYT